MTKTPVGPFLLSAPVFLLASLFVTCQSAPAGTGADLASLQGHWECRGPGGDCTVTISGNSLRFYARSDFWFDTTITLPADADPPQFHATIVDESSSTKSEVGRVVVALYRFEDGTLTLAVVDDFDEPPPGPIAATWDKTIDRYELTKAQPQDNASQPSPNQ